MKVREGRVEDVPFMISIERTSAMAAHWSERQYRDLFQSIQNGVQRLVLIAEQDDSQPAQVTGDEKQKKSVVGFLVARHIAPDWEVENVVVKTSTLRQGYGTRLLETFLAFARGTGSHTVFLEVRESNLPARALYERAGFLLSDRRKSYYSNPLENALVYHRGL